MNVDAQERGTGRRRIHHVVVFWLFAFLTLVLLVLSLSGDGSGALQSGLFDRMLWSYVVVALGVAVTFWAFLPPRGCRTNREEPAAKDAPPERR